MCVYCYCPKGKVEALSKYDGFHSKCFVLHLRCKIVICTLHVHVIIYISGCGFRPRPIYVCNNKISCDGNDRIYGYNT